jgi:hypothetical protein
MDAEAYWTVRVEGPRSFEVSGPVSYDRQREFLERLASDQDFRRTLEGGGDEAYAALENDHGITVSRGTLPERPSLPPEDKVMRALEDLADTDNSRSQVKGILFAILHG